MISLLNSSVRNKSKLSGRVRRRAVSSRCVIPSVELFMGEAREKGRERVGEKEWIRERLGTEKGLERERGREGGREEGRERERE